MQCNSIGPIFGEASKTSYPLTQDSMWNGIKVTYTDKTSEKSTETSKPIETFDLSPQEARELLKSDKKLDMQSLLSITEALYCSKPFRKES